MSKKLDKWIHFSRMVEDHIEGYVIPQYGDDGEAPDKNYTEADCIKQAERYLARHGRNSRPGQATLDLLKATHWIQMAFDRQIQPTFQEVCDAVN
jgi:hypothetical protein